MFEFPPRSLEHSGGFPKDLSAPSLAPCSLTGAVTEQRTRPLPASPASGQPPPGGPVPVSGCVPREQSLRQGLCTSEAGNRNYVKELCGGQGGGGGVTAGPPPEGTLQRVHPSWTSRGQGPHPSPCKVEAAPQSRPEKGQFLCLVPSNLPFPLVQVRPPGVLWGHLGSQVPPHGVAFNRGLGCGVCKRLGDGRGSRALCPSRRCTDLSPSLQAPPQGHLYPLSLPPVGCRPGPPSTSRPFASVRPVRPRRPDPYPGSSLQGKSPETAVTTVPGPRPQWVLSQHLFW